MKLIFGFFAGSPGTIAYCAAGTSSHRFVAVLKRYTLVTVMFSVDVTLMLVLPATAVTALEKAEPQAGEKWKQLC